MSPGRTGKPFLATACRLTTHKDQEQMHSSFPSQQQENPLETTKFAQLISTIVLSAALLVLGGCKSDKAAKAVDSLPATTAVVAVELAATPPPATSSPPPARRATSAA